MINKDFFSKSTRILRIVFIFLFLLIIRIWHLCAIQKDAKKMEAKRPQRRVILEKAQRGTIRDRFDLPLAMNRIRFNATIYYGQIQQIPRIRWVKKNGEKIKTYPRKEYIEQLVSFLSKKLNIPKNALEDQIHAKASLFPHVPYILKENISEKTYFNLKFVERKWPGLYAEISSTRYYPKNKVASSIIGTMSTINEKEFVSNAEEIKILEKYLEKQFDLDYEAIPFGYQSNYEVLFRLKELKEKAYTMNDLVGKYGIEKKFENELRGTYGKKIFEVNVKGAFVKELPLYTPPISGNNIKLTISAELQEFAEKLLATRSAEKLEHTPSSLEAGGAIVVMDPNNGEVLALASHPTYNPNDFIPSLNAQEKLAKNEKILQWLETKNYIGSIWDGKKSITKEYFDKHEKKFKTVSKEISWDLFIENLIPKSSPIFKTFQKISTIKNAISIQESVETLIYFTKTANVELLFDVVFPEAILAAPKSSPAEKELLAEKLKVYSNDVALPLEHLKETFEEIKHNKDKLLIIDIFRIAVFNASFSNSLISVVGHLTLSDYFQYGRQLLHFEKLIKEKARTIFDQIYFQIWRENNLTNYLKDKREEEKKKKTYAKPYTDYLEQKKQKLFTKFWEEHKTSFLLLVILGIDELENSHFKVFHKWHEQLKNNNFDLKKMQNCFQSLYPFFKQKNPKIVKNFTKTIRCFDELKRPLYGRYRKVTKNLPKEKDLAMLIYPHEGFGYMRSLAFQCPLPLGSIFKIVTTYEALKQNKQTTSPFSMIDKVEYGPDNQFIVGYSLNNKPYKRIYKKGRLPKSSHYNIGKIDLFSAIEQSSNPYFSILATDYIAQPEDLNKAAYNFGFGRKTTVDLIGEYSGNLPNDLKHNRTGLYSYAIGHHTLTATPLQTCAFLSTIANEGKLYKPKIVKQILGSHRDINKKETFLYQNYLRYLGIHVPVFSINDSGSFTMIHEVSSVVNNKVFMPKNLKDAIFESMKRVVHGKKGTARVAAIKSLQKDPNLRDLYKEISKKMIGKTSTAEIFYAPYIAASEKAKLNKHACFAAISFKNNVLESEFNEHQLVVVVYLPFGKAGKQAAPLAAQIIAKWEEISSRAERY